MRRGAHTHLWSILADRERQDDEDQHERTEDLAEEVAAVVADGRSGTEGGQLGGRIIRGIVVVLVEEVDQDGPEETAEHLRDDVGNDQ